MNTTSKRTLRRAAAGLVCAALGASASAQEPAAPVAPPESPQERGRAILVIDASNSMWGRIDERPKIEIAREAVSGLLDGWSDDVDVGLMAYGHRREGDCSDIEMIAETGAPDRPELAEALAGLTPRGKTPMSAAVSMAAEQLAFEDRPASVILVSDGRETCNADPCAVAEALEARGVAFTAHVVGFDVADPDTIAQLSCIAENTGGRYVSADSAEELSQALAETGGAAADATLRLRALEGEGGPVIRSGVEWTIAAEADIDLPDPDGPQPDIAAPPGAYTVTAARGDEEASADIVAEAGETATLTVAFALPDARLEAPDEVAAGAFLTVSYSGPAGDDDYITHVEPDAREGAYGRYEYAPGERGEVELRAPDEPGVYEVRHMSEAGRTLAARRFSVTETAASLEVPETVGAGSSVAIAWSGPDNEGDYITIVRPDAPDGEYARYAYTEGSGGTVELRAPDEPGTWQARYRSGGDGAVYARATFEVEAVEAALDAPAEVGAGAHFAIAWTGPDNEGDYITIVEPEAGEGTYGTYAYVADSGGAVSLRAPDEPGEWELRYLSGADDRTFARTRVDVLPVEASVEPPETARAGEDIAIAWTGPENEGDYIAIARPDAPRRAYESYAYVADSGGAVSLTAPEQPGTWEVRYLSGGDAAVFARARFEVAAE
ncbi:hypothetical protein DDZ18_05535 [Marinicauda salina]|uniref:VWFA domain-containing protein n=1 Tax=Marinicauda salina TaxID=2135793 RepID=A0A2U2BVH5_9PROT|nr:VWA domain-containing protein [Marinicauda salina]PWE18031.1 hypothetical protein DDZ18_05535 [Marinicauda salina]